MKVRHIVLALSLVSSLVFANDAKVIQIHNGQISEEAYEGSELAYFLSRADAVPEDGSRADEDSYLEGYIQALLNCHFYEFDILVVVKEEVVYLYNLPKNDLLRNSIICFVQDLPQVRCVKAVCGVDASPVDVKRNCDLQPQVCGIWFPQSTLLYPPMIADPMVTDYSVVYRKGDDVMGDSAIAVSYGDVFPIFRWKHVGARKGDVQIGIQAGVWSVFNISAVNDQGEWSELVNTDYLLGIPVTYAFDKWAFRFRVYHISGHVGDEYLVHHPDFVRKNPSMEAFDAFASCQVSDGLRLYAGAGYVLHSDRSFRLKPFYVEYGGELRAFGCKSAYHKLYGTTFLAVYFRNWQENHWQFDGNVMAGYEWSKLHGIGRKVRLYLQYFNGYSEGQFFRQRSSYGGVGFGWGF